MDEPFLGQVQLFAPNFAPAGWALCAGQTLQVSAYSSLFSLLGNKFGGDGVTTFKLPDLRNAISHPMPNITFMGYYICILGDNPS